MRLRVGSATSVGRVRPINEDAFLSQPSQGLFVVCDGMGGAAAGEVASKLAVDTMAAQVARTPLERGAGGMQPRTVALDRAIQAANRAIYERARLDTEHAGMGTTVVAAWAGDGVVSLGHVGDSRAYLASAAGFASVTSDHSLVEAQVRAGQITREESLKSAHQNVLLRALGRDAHIEVELAERRVAVGDRLLLCTDGLTRMVPDPELAEALDRFQGDPQGACDHLIAVANARGGPDNITVVIVEFAASGVRGLLGSLLGR